MKESNINLENAINFLLKNFSDVDIDDPNEFLYNLAVSPSDYGENFKKNSKYKLWKSLNNKNMYEHIEQKKDKDDDNKIIGIFKVNDEVYLSEWTINSYDTDQYQHILKTFKKVKPVKKEVIVYEVE